ncbi:ankyrin repeat-containing domain protein [Aspergillus granulosus]|uniref:Ankyrin repeat-containing domain protein n=1 Tax=Aspergillus granulosus TaxID=176169 RepID=A0ABR4HU89_9EURO
MSHAAAMNRLDVTQLLNDFMQFNKIPIHQEHSPLFCALQHRRHGIAKWLIHHGIGHDHGINGVRPIAAAAAQHFNDLVEELLRRGVPANSANPDDRSALVAAVTVNNVLAAKLLLQAGAGTNVSIEGDPDFEEKGKESLLLWAAAKGLPNTVAFLIQYGWDVNGNYVAFGKPPLAYAAAANRTVSMHRLIDNGADLEFCDTDGLTPLYWAAREGNWEAVKILIEAGANPDPFDVDGNSPLINAAARSFETVQLLVEAGADVNEQSTAGSTALINAAARDQADSVRLLIQHGACIEAKARGQTALSWAIASNALNAARVLVEAGADVTAPDAQGRTPLGYATNEAALAVLYSRTYDI